MLSRSGSKNNSGDSRLSKLSEENGSSVATVIICCTQHDERKTCCRPNVTFHDDDDKSRISNDLVSDDKCPDARSTTDRCRAAGHTNTGGYGAPMFELKSTNLPSPYRTVILWV